MTNREVAESDAHKGSFKERALAELKLFWVIALYLWIVLGSFTVFRRLIVADVGSTYLHYGIALIEALVIAKVILIGKMFGFTRRYEDRPLIVPVIYKSLLFGALVIVFGIIERIVEGWFHGEGLFGGLRSLRDVSGYDLGARVLMLVLTLFPLFAFTELGRVIGAHKLATMFFSKRDA